MYLISKAKKKIWRSLKSTYLSILKIKLIIHLENREITSLIYLINVMVMFGIDFKDFSVQE